VLVPGGRLVCVVGDVCVSRRRFGRHLVFPFTKLNQPENHSLNVSALIVVGMQKVRDSHQILSPKEINPQVMDSDNPSLSELSMELQMFYPDLAGQRYTINVAIRKAIERLGVLFDLESEPLEPNTSSHRTDATNPVVPIQIISSSYRRLFQRVGWAVNVRGDCSIDPF